MAKVELKSARTTEKDPAKAAEEIARALAGASAKLVTVFASSDRDHAALNRALLERLPEDRKPCSDGNRVDKEDQIPHPILCWRCLPGRTQSHPQERHETRRHYE